MPRAASIELVVVLCLVAPTIGRGQSILDRIKRSGVVTVRRDSSAGRATPATRTDAASHPLPTSSRATVDVFGIRLGIATLEDVRSTLSGQTPPFTIVEHPVQLTGNVTAGRGRLVDVPNGRYVRWVRAVARSSPTVICGTIDCETIEAGFATPPSRSTVLSLRRTLQYAHGPTVENVERAVFEKYGQPGFRSAGADYASYAWAWSAEGTPVTLLVPQRAGADLVLSCARSVGANANFQGDVLGGSPFERDAYATGLLQSGCAAVLHLDIRGRNGVVSAMTYFAYDAFGILDSDTKTEAFVSGYVDSLARRERENAAAVQVRP